MRKSTLIKLCFSAAWLVASSWMFAAPAPIQRGQLKRGAPVQAAPVPGQAKAAPVNAESPKAVPAKPLPAKPEPAKVAPVKKPAPAKKPAAAKVGSAKKPVSRKAVPAKKPAPPKPVPPDAAFPRPDPPPPVHAKGVSCPPMEPYRGAIAVDADTGRILFSDNMRRLAYPASVTKLMTFLLVLEDIQSGLYGPNDRAVASALAASMEPSKVDLRPGQSMTIHDLLLSIMVKSANDAAEALAEHSAFVHRRRRGVPTENVAADELRAEFVERMNRRARELGMRDTRYASPNGLPPPQGSKRGFDVSTAADLVELGKVIVRMPKALSYTSRPWCKVTDGSGKPMVLAAHNYFLPGTRDTQRLCTPVPGCDGLKTGYTAASGNSIMLTASRNGRRVIVIVLGSAGRHNREKAAGVILRDALDAICIW